MNLKTFNRDTWHENQTEREFFVEDLKLKVHFYNGSLNIMDITNALKTGKICERYSFNWQAYDSIKGIRLMEAFNWDVKKLFDFAQSLRWERGRYGIEEHYFSLMEESDITIYKSEEKSIRVFSPFALNEVKPLKEIPKKWTVRHATRAILNHQYEWFKCNGVYTDDYAFDAAYNYQEGEIGDNMAFAERLIERPSGWWAGDHNSKNGDVIVSICCHTFDLNEFKFKIA